MSPHPMIENQLQTAAQNMRGGFCFETLQNAISPDGLR